MKKLISCALILAALASLGTMCFALNNANLAFTELEGQLQECEGGWDWIQREDHLDYEPSNELEGQLQVCEEQ